MHLELPDDWRLALAPVLDSEGFRELGRFVDEERRRSQVFPPEQDVFAAFALTPLSSVKVVILGQDPYHDDGQAHGLCFSVKPPTKPPPSLRNIFKELESDVGIVPPGNGDLTAWSRQGVLLLNTVLTVRAHEPASHTGRGWEKLTDAAVSAVSARAQPAVFCLWGAHAKKKRALIDETRHVVVEGAHPSPLSASSGFFGSKPFSAINQALTDKGVAPVSWNF
jgi:uracil-DNA glycosylase